MLPPPLSNFLTINVRAKSFKVHNNHHWHWSCYLHLVRKVQEVKDALKKEDFEKVASRLSEHYTKVKGGDDGFKKPGDIQAVFKSTLDKMAKNQISEPIELEGNMFWIKFSDKRGGEILPLLKVREQIKYKLEDDQERKFYKEFITTLRKKASIEDFTKK